MAQSDEAAVVRRLMIVTRMAVVGLSDDPSRPSRLVTRYLMNHGREIVPVNPNYEELLGQPCYPDLASIPQPPALAIVFRKSEDAPAVVRDAIEAGVRGVWLQQGITSRLARQMARDHGLDFVEDRCIKIELMMSRR